MLNKLQILLAPFWLQFQRQLDANQRLRWMMWGVVYIVIFYVGLTLAEWRDERAQKIELLSRTSIKLNQLEHQKQWSERRAKEKEVATGLRAKLWETQSESFAEADVQNYLRRLMADHKAQNYRPRLAPTERIELGGETLVKVTAEVSGSVAVDQIDHLLKAIADNPKLLDIQRFNYSAQRGGQLDLILSAYFVIADQQGSINMPVQEQQAIPAKATEKDGENVVR
jgi:hypothetical protein